MFPDDMTGTIGLLNQKKVRQQVAGNDTQNFNFAQGPQRLRIC
jgi:hypothetical protein